MCCNAIHVMVHLYLSMHDVIYNPFQKIYSNSKQVPRKMEPQFFTYIFGLAEEKTHTHTLVALQVQQVKKHQKKKRITCGVELVPIFRDPGSPSENGFLEPKYYTFRR